MLFHETTFKSSAHFFETTVPSYFPDEFKSHFRMTRQTFELFALIVAYLDIIP